MLEEDAICRAIESKGENRRDLDQIWNVLSDKMNVMALNVMIGEAKQTSSRAKLVL
jgi:hypothetical protein